VGGFPLPPPHMRRRFPSSRGGEINEYYALLCVSIIILL